MGSAAGQPSGQPAAYPQGQPGYAVGQPYQAPSQYAAYQQPVGQQLQAQQASQPYARPPQQARVQGYPQPYYPQYAQYAAAQPGYSGDAYVAPATSQPAAPAKHRRGKGFWIGMAVALMALIAAAVFAWFVFFGDDSSNRAGDLGQLDGKTDAEIQAELDRIVEEGMFNISIASHVQFADGSSEGDLRIENVPNNPYLMQVVITRDDTGETIYESGVLEQNHHIQKDKLDVDLPAGQYMCTATFHALDPQTEEEVGTAAAHMTIDVQA